MLCTQKRWQNSIQDFAEYIGKSGCRGLTVICFYTAAVNAVAADREFYIQAVEHKGKTHVSSEPFPLKPLQQAPGMKVKAPAADGTWKVESYGFSPGQITVMQGDRVTLNFVGINGAFHNIKIVGVDDFRLTRGTMKVVQFTADEPGLIQIICLDHKPNMTGQIVVLPKSASAR